MNIIRNFRRSRVFSATMIFAFLSLNLSPSITYALSSGPGQPELEGFAPIGMDNMVDPFTGDFSYNLPLLNVPGPDGGYPINMSYNAGVNMEQEASWVGLGWSLNPGAINREVRGLPDDFDGQKITKKLTNKPNTTISFGIAAANIEILGLDLKKVSQDRIQLGGNINLSYNNYKGFDVQAGLGFSLKESDEAGNSGAAKNQTLIDLYDGTRKVTESFSDLLTKSKKSGNKQDKLQGPKVDYVAYYKNMGSNLLKNENLLGFSSAKTTSDISFDHPRVNYSTAFNVKGGLTLTTVTADLQVDVFFSEQRLLQKTIDLPAFGYLYSENNYSLAKQGLMDFSRDNQSTLTPDSRLLPVPVMTNDIFHVSAQGMSGKVRAYKASVSLLTDPESYSRTGNGGGGFELDGGAPPPEVKGGANFRLSYAESYSGPWKSGASSIDFLKSSSERSQKKFPGSEPYFFRFANELTAQTNKGTVHTDKSTSNLKLGIMFEEYNAHPKLRNDLRHGRVSELNESTSYRTQRERRGKLFQTLTSKEASDFTPFTRTLRDTSGTTVINVDRVTSGSDPRSRAIGEVDVTDEMGQRYIFGIPAQNKLQKQNTFSVNSSVISNGLDPVGKVVSYSSTENSLSNESGNDHFFASTETPEHAHSFLLTEVLSQDYVDVTRNGPTRDDFGSYTKFDYKVDKGFRTKSPINGANYSPGKLSNATDDKAAITYFEKDLYYLHTIRTKTHVAVFETRNRHDGRGISGENDNNPQNGNDGQLKRLHKITLYNVEDFEANPATAKPIKTVNFEYNYELCSGTPNSTASGGGKLTLKKVWFGVGSERTKASLSPYEFGYDLGGYTYNPENVDRWGCYQPESDNPFGSNVLFPYSQQEDRALSDTYASAWCLTKIKLPTGGMISIDYESDDYRFVQNRKAQAMYAINGFVYAQSGTVISTLLEDKNDLGPGGDIWVVIELPQTISSEEVDNYFEGVDETYYKAFIKYKKNAQSDKPPQPFNQGSDIAYDFVEGYLEFDSAPQLFPAGSTVSKKVMIKVKELGDNHPIKKAGWIEMKLNRTDLLDESKFGLSNFNTIDAGTIKALSNILGAALNFSEGDPFFKEASKKDYCDRMGTELPSIIRLNAPWAKIGGGHRVKRVQITDNWTHSGESSEMTYGQEYSYENEDGSSSGVAQYEPLAGGEENPFREPERYSSDRILIKDDYLYTELPIGESFYPSASVGYSRVKIKNLANNMVSTSGAGIQVKEFYTARDYPLKVESTGLEKVNVNDVNSITKFIGGKSFFEPGFSQGYKIELNNMHGKVKSVATYSAYPQKAEEGPVQKTEYFYKTKGGEYAPGEVNYLDNTATVYYGDGVNAVDEIGVNQDTYIDMKETNSRSISAAVDGNLSTLILFVVPIPLPSAVPNIDYHYSMTRVAVMNKVIERTGILEKVVNTQTNAETIVENLAFDYDTGEPVMVSTTNQFGSKVYRYDQKAKWYYQNMQGGYHNAGLKIFDGQDAATIAKLQVGDVLLSETGQVAWVNGPGQATTVSNTTLSGAQLEGFKVIQSGYSNNLTTSAGFIESLVDFRDSSFTLPVLDLYHSTLVPLAMMDSTDQRKPVLINPVSYNIVHEYSASSEKYFYKRNKHQQANLVDCNFPGGIPIMYRASTETDWFNSSRVYQQATGTTDTIKLINSYVPAGLTHTVTIYNFNDLVSCMNCPDFDGSYPIVFRTPLGYEIDDFEIRYLGGSDFLALHESGAIFNATGYDGNSPGTACPGFGNCLSSCLVMPVLNSSVTTYSEDLKYIGDLPSTISAATINGNPARYGYKGLYKSHKTFFTPQKRTPTQASPYDYPTDVAKNGEFENYLKFNYYTSNAEWKEAMEITKYDFNGVAIEQQDAIGNFSSVLYGYNRTLPIAIGQNAQYEEISFDGFEDHGTSYLSAKKDNHINFGTAVGLSPEWDAHTGRYSAKLLSSQATGNLNLVQGKEYIVQAWHKTASGGTLKASNGSDHLAKAISPNIDGWELLEVRFVAGVSNMLKINVAGAQFDDIRVLPFNASMKSFVYDRFTHKLLATLDENNFATLYNYDRDQVLVQVKKETERGVKTIQSTQRVTNQQSSLN